MLESSDPLCDPRAAEASRQALGLGALSCMRPSVDRPDSGLASLAFRQPEVCADRCEHTRPKLQSTHRALSRICSPVAPFACSAPWTPLDWSRSRDRERPPLSSIAAPVRAQLEAEKQILLVRLRNARYHRGLLCSILRRPHWKVWTRVSGV